MKSLFALAVMGMVSSTALAASGLDLAKAKNCLACHSVDTKIVGPAYKEVAKKYTAQKGAEAMLVQKVMKGGSGVWGQVPMPPNQVSEEEAKTLVKWALSLK